MNKSKMINALGLAVMVAGGLVTLAKGYVDKLEMDEKIESEVSKAITKMITERES